MRRVYVRGLCAAVAVASVLSAWMLINWRQGGEPQAFAQAPVEDVLQRILGLYQAEMFDSTGITPLGAAVLHFHKANNTYDIEVEIDGLIQADVGWIEIVEGPSAPNPGTVVVTLYDGSVPTDLTAVDGHVIYNKTGLSFPAASVDTLLAGKTYIQVRKVGSTTPEMKGDLLSPLPPALRAADAPLPTNLNKFVKDTNKAILLGKALFWDMQVGGDGRTACATCHFHAGADARTWNAIGLPPNREGVNFRGANTNLKTSDFPFHRLADPDNRNSTVLFDTGEIAGSQGVIKRKFVSIVKGSAIDNGTATPDAIFKLGGCNARQVEPRNTPTTINAVFNDRNFWDGRANRFFNGVDPFGDTNPGAKVFCTTSPTTYPSAVNLGLELDNSSLASQAVGPPLSDFEMSWLGRTFPELGRKMLSLKPLALQVVHKDDSVLGPYANLFGKGLVSSVSYSQLIKDAFQPKWWQFTGNVTTTTPPGGQFTQMEANFSLFWGLSILLYERTLVSDDTPFDRFANKLKLKDEAGARAALTPQQLIGLELFLNEGKCINCHKGAEFTGAAISQRRQQLVEHMLMANGKDKKFYDGGFYNIAVRPTEQDLGVGGSGPFGPFSLARRKANGGSVPGVNFDVDPNRLAVDGAFKVPTIRNTELTGPYFHNGGQRTLEEVVQFYVRGTDFHNHNRDNLDPDVGGIDEMKGRPDLVAALAAFMRSLTDERVRYRKAPFDHPEILVPNGHTYCSFGSALDNLVKVPATGRYGGAPVKTFAEILAAGGFNANNL